MKAKTVVLMGHRTEAKKPAVKHTPGIVRQTLSKNYAAAQEPGSKAGSNTKEFAKQAAVVVAAGVGTLAGSVAAFAKGLWN